MEKLTIGDRVVCTDATGVPEWTGLVQNKEYVIRSIGERTGGLRLEGIELYRDFTDYEKCFGASRFAKVANDYVMDNQQTFVVATYLWENGMVMTLGRDGQQIPELQGKHTPELVEAIRARSDEKTKWNGFARVACVWPAALTE